MKIISVDIQSEFGFFKKPDTNEIVYITFNCIHKPAILGILGAIIGLSGYFENNIFPDYYSKLKNLKIGIKPLDMEKTAFQKTIIRYNNSLGYASKEEGGNLIIEEQTIIKPKYRIFIANEHPEFEKIYNNLKSQTAVFLPYMGKNDFSLWWDNFQEYSVSEFNFDIDYQIDSIFIKEKKIKDNTSGQITQNYFDIFNLLKSKQKQQNNITTFIIFERLPIGFNEKLKRYDYEEFVYTNSIFNKDYKIKNLYKINDKIIQLF
ncbi:MAG TPA: type I-B CRISPR-associated protein Cas5b [bacterium]|nr:type I-B CRISPR-associated protein Cas5b [bacterium]HOL48775.1 type I-B CRISPR-associated protein Cas5b [bacterium]HPQ19907.1 type I-B CRISPR-associated protein Cas5b [bacterium]